MDNKFGRVEVADRRLLGGTRDNAGVRSHEMEEKPVGELRGMGIAGDKKEIWNPDNPDEVASAKRTFDDLVKKKRFLAFAVKKSGEKGKQITEFDPKAGKIIIAPPMAGG